MSDLKKLLDRCKISKIEYIYPEHIQEELDRIDRAVKDVDELYQDKLAFVDEDDVGKRAGLKVSYDASVAPLLSAKAGLLESTVPKVILHLEKKSPCIKSL